MGKTLLPALMILLAVGVLGGLVLSGKQGDKAAPSNANKMISIIPSEISSPNNGLQLKSFKPPQGPGGGGSSGGGGESSGGGGCTFTIGYWKNHAGLGPQEDMVTRHLPIWLGTPNGPKSLEVTTAAQAVDLLNKEYDASNGISKLYAQGLGTKLNIKSGSTNWPSVINPEVDPFLAQHNSAEWTILGAALQQKVLMWASMFDDYNNGITGPGHCPS